MKRLMKIVLVFFCCTWLGQDVLAQSKTRKVMLEQIAKLQVYLEYLKKGYDIVQDGLHLVSEIKNGDFNLHYLFFDRLKQVSPKVKQYSKVADIISMQLKMLTAYKNNYKQFKQIGTFSSDELDYLFQTLSNLLDFALADINDLTNLLTDGEFAMSDDERIVRVDELWKRMNEKYQHLFSFLDEMKALSQQRKQELRDIQKLKNMYAP
jgi:hypothetical protein